jgi:hypothetical protein
MANKTPLILLFTGLMIALALFFFGCSTEKPWATNPNPPLSLSLISGPTDSLGVPIGSVITYSWTYTGGKGTVQYQYNIDGGDWTALSKETVATVRGFSMGYHSFTIKAQDEANATSQYVAVFRTTEPNTPTVAITEAPEAGSFVASGSTVTFTWAGNDGGTGPDYLLYQYSFAGATSDWAPTLTVSFENVVADSPAVFTVQAKDLGGNSSEVDSVSFVIKNATIMYIDDYLWLDTFGNADRAQEREQKAFYREALKGYSFVEWDNDVHGAPPTMADLVGITTIIWAADDNVCAADPNYRLWYDIGANGGGVLKDFIDAGGHLLITGSQVIPYLFNTNPPISTDFESAYLGVSDTVIIDSITTTWWLGGTPYDTLVVNPDSVVADTAYVQTWQSETDFTWAIKDAALGTGYPDSMKIDVAKNGNQSACDASLDYLKYGVQPLFTVGLDVAGDAPPDYGKPIGWIYAPAGHAISASLMFDTFSMPLPGIRQTFHTILNEFGEGPEI